jgi:hypothetical protein
MPAINWRRNTSTVKAADDRNMTRPNALAAAPCMASAVPFAR